MLEEESEDQGKEIAPSGGNGAWKPFTSESGKDAALKRIQYQRELKERARLAQQIEAAEMVQDIMRLQKQVLEQALTDEEVEYNTLSKQRMALDVGEKALDRLLGKATTKTQVEDVTEREQTEEEAIDAEWVVEDDDSEAEPEGEG